MSRGHKTFLTGFWGVLPCQKGPKFLASVLNELVSRNWGAPLNFRKLLSTSTDKFQAYSPQRDGFQKLRGAPQFPETALQSSTTDIASTTSINDCFQMSFKQHDFQLPFSLSKMIANQRICSVSEEYNVDTVKPLLRSVHNTPLNTLVYLSMSVKWLVGLYLEAAAAKVLPRRRLFR